MGTELRLREGDWQRAEEEALDILNEERRQGSKAISDRQFWLTPAQLDHRYNHEIYNMNGVPEIHLGSGIYHRVYNPLFGKRPKRQGSRGSSEPEWDTRVPHGTSAALGWMGDQWYGRSTAWATDARNGEHWHLTPGQRSRIRKLMQQVSARADAREAMKGLLSEKYGVPPWIISRVCLRGCKKF